MSEHNRPMRRYANPYRDPNSRAAHPDAPRTEAGKRLMHHMTQGGIVETPPWQDAILAIEAEAEAAALERVRAGWDEAKRRKLSIMHDVGAMAAEIDRLLEGRDAR